MTLLLLLWCVFQSEISSYCRWWWWWWWYGFRHAITIIISNEQHFPIVIFILVIVINKSLWKWLYNMDFFSFFVSLFHSKELFMWIIRLQRKSFRCDGDSEQRLWSLLLVFRWHSIDFFFVGNLFMMIAMWLRENFHWKNLFE